MSFITCHIIHPSIHLISGCILRWGAGPEKNADYSVQFSSVAQSCPTPCDPMNRSTPGLPVHHQLPEFTQTHVHRVGDAIQPLSSPSPPALNPSQHQRLFQWVNSSHEVAKVLEFQLQHHLHTLIHSQIKISHDKQLCHMFTFKILRYIDTSIKNLDWIGKFPLCSILSASLE